MDILFVADVSISNVIGGAERVLFEQTTRMAQRGHNIHVLTRKLPVHQHYQEVVAGVREWRYNAGRHLSALSFLINTWQNSKKLFESRVNKIGFDLINFHQPFSAMGTVSSPFSKKIKKIYTCHSLSFEEYISRNSKPDGFIRNISYYLNIFFRKWLEKSALKQSDKVIVLSRFTQAKLWNAYRIASQKISIIPGGVDLIRFQPVDDKIEIRRRLNIHNNKVVLFTVRNLVPRMGLENLIHAMQKTVKTASDVYLVVGGEGPLKSDLIKLAKNFNLENNIKFAGFIDEKKLADYYRMADLFVLPTKELEGFGLVTLEAMACGVPVLGTPVGGTQEILRQFDSSFLFNDTRPDAMAELINKKYQIIKRDTKEWEAISMRCRKFVEENYSWEKNIDALEKVFFEHQ